MGGGAGRNTMAGHRVCGRRVRLPHGHGGIAMSMLKEFQEFIDKGDVMDMAVGIIIGGAFTSIVSALTNDIVKPTRH